MEVRWHVSKFEVRASSGGVRVGFSLGDVEVCEEGESESGSEGRSMDGEGCESVSEGENEGE